MEFGAESPLRRSVIFILTTHEISFLLASVPTYPLPLRQFYLPYPCAEVFRLAPPTTKDWPHVVNFDLDA